MADVIPETTHATPTLAWIGGVGGSLRIIDQTLLPGELRLIDLATPEQVWEAIRVLRVRGAPAIGVAAAYGVVIGLQTVLEASRPDFDRRLAEVAEYLNGSRPTAVNLAWALARMLDVAASLPELPRLRWPPDCWRKRGRSKRKTARCVPPSAARGPTSWPTARAC